MNSKYISGINPSIAKLVYLLNFWGVKTSGSHASFYPGDTEEQEYWIQKNGKKENFNIECDGPVILWGDIFQLPHIFVTFRFHDITTFQNQLPQHWEISSAEKSLTGERDLENSYILKFNHPRLLKFKQVWDDSFLEVLDKFNLTDPDLVFKNNTWKKVNEYLISNLPLSNPEFNTIRNQGIKHFEESLLQSINNFDDHRFKHLVDEFIVDLNLREDYDLSYFRDISEK